MSTALQRTAFVSSRLQDYFSESELTQQMGYARNMWPLVLLKELLDNALDACESAGVSPKILILIEDDGFTVTDTGPGLPVKIIKRALDYRVRISDKRHYVAPTRGQADLLGRVWQSEYRKFAYATFAAKRLKEIEKDFAKQFKRPKTPRDLQKRVARHFKKDSVASWDSAIASIAIQE